MSGGGWKVVGAAAEGVSHIKSGLPCQDAAGYQVVTKPDGLNALIAAVSDGAGSAEHSEIGAQTAVQAVLEYLERALSEGETEAVNVDAQPAAVQEEQASDADAEQESSSSEVDPVTVETLASGDAAILLRGAYAAARQAVLVLAEREGHSSREVAATLTCALALKDSIAVGQLGDGCIVAAWENGDTQALTHPQRGEYANETYFLTQEDALEHVEVQAFEKLPVGLALMSDGLLRLALDLASYTPHVPFFKPLFSFAAAHGTEPGAVEQLEAFLRSERVGARTDDDKSLVLTVRMKQ